MTHRVDFDRRLTSWLEEDAAPHAPGESHARFIEGMASARQRPGWATTERWISMETRAQLGAMPRALIVVATFALLTVFMAGAIAIGSGITAPSPKGLIAFKHTSGDVWTVKPDGSDASVAVAADGRNLIDPAWSPDGTRLAYWSENGSFSDLIVSRADGSDAVVVADDVRRTGVESKDWSPDGTRLTFTALQEGASGVCGSDEVIFCGSRVFVAAADGSTGAVQVGDPDLDAREAIWSPDGASIAFGAGGGPQDIRLHVMDSDGGDVRVVSDLQGEMWALNQIDWSPDGRTVTGTTGLPTWDVWAIPIDGGTEFNVSGPSWSEDEPVDRLFPAYAADGALAWTGGWGKESCACLTLREGEADPVNLPDFGGIPTWSPDGRFLVTATASPTAVVIIDRQGNVHATIADAVDEWVSWKDSAG